MKFEATIVVLVVPWASAPVAYTPYWLLVTVRPLIEEPAAPEIHTPAWAKLLNATPLTELAVANHKYFVVQKLREAGKSARVSGELLSAVGLD